ncbi:hypothetical protein [Paludisphaera soli]|uniref:hypothetical protein n=1 Tax=Paludisphaera soli TaxID=2712865 RepID=UPI0013EE0457|nr:hypothetical protein [Paludisphaera soli]
MDKRQISRRLAFLRILPRPRTWAILLILGFLFWQLIPDAATMPFNPWFLDQVEEGNVKSLILNGLEAHGELREPREFQAKPGAAAILVRRYRTQFPTEAAVQSAVDDLMTGGETLEDRVLIERRDEVRPNETASRVLFTSAIASLAFWYGMRRGYALKVAADAAGLGTASPEPPGPATP